VENAERLCWYGIHCVPIYPGRFLVCVWHLALGVLGCFQDASSRHHHHRKHGERLERRINSHLNILDQPGQKLTCENRPPPFIHLSTHDTSFHLVLPCRTQQNRPRQQINANMLSQSQTEACPLAMSCLSNTKQNIHHKKEIASTRRCP